MANYIPFVVVAEILILLPTRSLMRFRSVSKTWKALIESSKFIADYSIQQSHQHHLLVKCYDSKERELKFFSVLDDDTFPHKKFPLIYPRHRGLTLPIILSVSEGVFCLYDPEMDYEDPHKSLIILWNPSIRKSIAIAATKVSGYDYRNAIGFGVCPHTCDPMLVNITYQFTSMNTTPRPWQVEVYTLSSRVWRSIPPINQDRGTIVVKNFHVAVDEFIYWLAVDRRIVNYDYMVYSSIISFDMTNDEITEVTLPDSLARRALGGDVALSKLNGSLAVLETINEAKKLVFNVWMMKRGVPNSFTKLFTLNAPDASINMLHAFRKNNEPIFGARIAFDADNIFVHELNSEKINCVGVYGRTFPSYMETLLLLDQ